MWCSFCIIFFLTTLVNISLPVLFHFLQFLLLNFVEKWYADWRKFNLWVSMGGVHSMAHVGRLHLVCAVCDVLIWRHIRVSKNHFSDINWRQAEAWIVFRSGAVEVNALDQGALRQSLSGCGSINQPSNWETETLPLSYCHLHALKP